MTNNSIYRSNQHPIGMSEILLSKRQNIKKTPKKVSFFRFYL